MSSLYVDLLNGPCPQQYPPQFCAVNRNEETITNFGQLYAHNSRPVRSPAELAVFHSAVGWPVNTAAWQQCKNIPANFLEQMQAKNQLLMKNKEIMEKQRAYIAQLEKQLGEQNTNDLLRRLQDREHDVEHLRARLEAETAPKYELEKLRRHLGESEYELEKTEKVLQEIINEKAEETKKFQENVATKASELDQTKKEVKRLHEEKSELMKRIESLDKYVSDLPTSEDYKKLRKELRYWKHLCSKLQAQMVKQEEKFNSGRKELEEKALNADKFESENADLRLRVKSLQDRMKNEEMHSKALELEQVTFENERLQADLTNMEKILKEKQRKSKQFYLHSQESQKKLAARLSQEEDTVSALREEVSAKEFKITELTSSMKQLSSQYQDAVEENMNISDKLKKLQIVNSKEITETNKKIHKQLRRSVNKLKDIMKLYYQKKEGRDLELSLLLGTGAEALRTETREEYSLVDEAAELLHDIEEFQKFLIDEYAEELANNLEGNNCVTQ